MPLKRLLKIVLYWVMVLFITIQMFDYLVVDAWYSLLETKQVIKYDNPGLIFHPIFFLLLGGFFASLLLGYLFARLGILLMAISPLMCWLFFCFFQFLIYIDKDCGKVFGNKFMALLDKIWEERNRRLAREKSKFTGETVV